MEPGSHPATYVEASALHLIVPGREWQNGDLRRAIAAKAMPSPFRPHIPPGWGSEPHPLPATFDKGRDLLLVTRHGMLHSHHRSAEALSEWMAFGGWRAAYVDGISSIVRERSARISVRASAFGLRTPSPGPIDCVSFCSGKLRFFDDPECCVSADEALTAQAEAARFQPSDAAGHMAHVAAIAAHVERQRGDDLSPGAFSDVAAAKTAIMGITSTPGKGADDTGAMARAMATKIYARLTAAEQVRSAAWTP